MTASKHALRQRLEALIERPIHRLTLTNNRTRIGSARPSKVQYGGRSDGLEVRLHRSFLGAEDAVLRAVAVVLGPGRGKKSSGRRDQALAVMREHHRQHAEDLPPTMPRLRPRGHHHDLAALCHDIDREYFAGALDAAITWGAMGRRPQRRRRSMSIRLGSYDAQRHLIRIHPVLDNAEVPEYVVAAIVYHELLHAAVPPTQGRTRRVIHTPEFRRRERLFVHYAAAETWISANLERLSALRSR